MFVQIFNDMIYKRCAEFVADAFTVHIEKVLMPAIETRREACILEIQREVSERYRQFDTTVKEDIAQICKNEVYLILINNYSYLFV